MDFPLDLQERRAALSAILKPFVDRAVAVCAQARQALLRSDADNDKFAKAQMERGYRGLTRFGLRRTWQNSMRTRVPGLRHPRS